MSNYAERLKITHDMWAVRRVYWQEQQIFWNKSRSLADAESKFDHATQQLTEQLNALGGPITRAEYLATLPQIDWPAVFFGYAEHVEKCEGVNFLDQFDPSKFGLTHDQLNHIGAFE